MNLPNKLSILRVIMVPVFVAIMVIPPKGIDWLETWVRIIAAAVFILTAVTDFIDGQIARRFNMVTDFGKFIDPLADKFMVFGALLGILYRVDDIRWIFIWAALIVIFRELAITSLRLLISTNSGEVVAAKWLGKVKTFTQCICIVVVILEPAIFPADSFMYQWHILSYVTIFAMVAMTLWSGYDYIRAYWKLLDPTK